MNCLKLFWQGILSDILKCLGDSKKQMRECTLSTLDSWLAAVQMERMVFSLTVDTVGSFLYSALSYYLLEF